MLLSFRQQQIVWDMLDLFLRTLPDGHLKIVHDILHYEKTKEFTDKTSMTLSYGKLVETVDNELRRLQERLLAQELPMSKENFTDILLRELAPSEKSVCGRELEPA